jgi:hypothetical protein
MKNFFYLLIAIVLIACNKAKVDEPFVSEVKVQLENFNFEMEFERVDYISKDVVFKFSTKEIFNCDRWRINCFDTDNSANKSLEFGSLFFATGYCTYGPFPATAEYRTPLFAEGKHKFTVVRDNQSYEGEIIVKGNKIEVVWGYDDVMKIKTKQFSL